MPAFVRQLDVDGAKVRSWELNAGLQFGWQEPSDLSSYLCLLFLHS